MNMAIVTGATPGYLGRDGAVLRRSVERYAEGHGVAYHWCDDFDPRRPPSWSRIPFLKRYCLRYDALLWLDADVLANPDGPDPRTMVLGEPDAEIFVAADGNGLNCGVMGLRGDVRNLLDWVWAQEQYRDHPWWEQAAFHDLYRSEPHRFQVVAKSIWNAYPGECGPETAFVHFPGDQRPHLHRFAAWARARETARTGRFQLVWPMTGNARKRRGPVA